MSRLAVAACLLLAACQGPRLLPASEARLDAEPGPPVATPAPAAARPAAPRVWAGPPCPAPRRGQVRLRKVDLQGVEGWLGEQSRRWILADVVDVYASKEFFAKTLTLTEKAGFVLRRDQRVGEDLVVTLTYIGNDGGQTVEHSPRALIGTDLAASGDEVTGLTVSARKALRVRLAKTNDPRRPVQLRIVARGTAVRGRGDHAEQRDPMQLEMGGFLRHDGRRWVWYPVGE